MSDIKDEKVQETQDSQEKVVQNDFSDKVENKEEVKVEGNEGTAEVDPEPEKKSKKKRSFLGSKNNNEELEKLKSENAVLNDKLLRLVAEFDNYKKRTLKEKTDLLKYGGESVLNAILPVVDDLERAKKSINEASEMAAVKEGLDLIFAKFSEFLNQQGIKEIEAVNLDLNTDYHEAITRFPAPTDEMKGKIIDVVQKGYMLHDKVMRFSKVVVGE